jgi:ElaB/YqjD/DUF883 family membrane-anchored ribosome-binding protein
VTTITDPSPLKYMGTQSQETVNLAAAMAHAVQSTDGRETSGSLAGEIDEAGSKAGDAASWAVGKAKDALQSAADQVRERAATAVATYTREDPIRAIVIAAVTGAVLMGLLSRMTRSGARAVERSVRR